MSLPERFQLSTPDNSSQLVTGIVRHLQPSNQTHFPLSVVVTRGTLIINDRPTDFQQRSVQIALVLADSNRTTGSLPTAPGGRVKVSDTAITYESTPGEPSLLLDLNAGGLVRVVVRAAENFAKRLGGGRQELEVDLPVEEEGYLSVTMLLNSTLVCRWHQAEYVNLTVQLSHHSPPIDANIDSAGDPAPPSSPSTAAVSMQLNPGRGVRAEDTNPPGEGPTCLCLFECLPTPCSTPCRHTRQR